MKIADRTGIETGATAQHAVALPLSSLVHDEFLPSLSAYYLISIYCSHSFVTNFGTQLIKLTQLIN